MKSWLVIFFLIPLFSVTLAQNKSEKVYYHDSTSWSADVPLWIPGVKGSMAYGSFDFGSVGRDEPVDRDNVTKSFGIEFYFGGRFVKRFNKVWLLADVFSGRIRQTFTLTTNVGGIENDLVDMTIQGIIPRVVGGYTLYKHRKESFSIEIVPYAGFRYLDLQLQSEFLDSTYNITLRPQWFEPIIGLYIPIYYKAFKLDLQADWGTNGINSTWIINTYLMYRISKLIDVKMGWAVLVLNHKREFASRPLEMNLVLTGPSLGVGFHF